MISKVSLHCCHCF